MPPHRGQVIWLTLGLIGVFFTIKVGWQLTRREIPIMIAVSILTYLLAMDGSLDRSDGSILLAGFLGFSALIYWLVRQEQRKVTASLESYEKQEKLIDSHVNRLFELARLTVGVFTLILGANWMVDGATAIARGLGVSEFVIGLTLVAVGTSLPELAASIIAARQGQTDIAVGNIVGSNIANLSLILGATASIAPLNVATNMLSLEIPVMIAFTGLMLLFSLDRIVQRREAVAMLAGYVGFVIFSVVR
jgi:cation:H+ antiporter